jgi:hypothetical protein
MDYPLFFTYRDIIVGAGFVAGVEVHGRALLREEEGGFWMYGVNPGGVAGGGQERAAAFQEFRLGYRSVLLDLATEGESFDRFAASVHAFIDEVNQPNEREWLLARAAVRAGLVTADLPRVEGDRPADVRVEPLSLQPNANALDEATPETLAA